MTDNQSTILVNSPNTKKAVAILQKFSAMEAQYKELETQKKEAEVQILEAMKAHNIRKIEGEWGYITLATRQTFKAIGTLAPRFTKVTMDSTKVKAHYTLTGNLPANVEVSETEYLTKKIK